MSGAWTAGPTIPFYLVIPGIIVGTQPWPAAVGAIIPAGLAVA